MNEMMLRLCLALMGEVFIFVLLAALEHQRRRIGVASLLMAFCATLLFGCIATAAGLTVPWFNGQSVNFSMVVVHPPLLAVFLLIYISRGVLKSQRLLIGTVCSYLLFLYFGTLVKLHCSFLPETPGRGVIFSLLNEMKESVNFNAVSYLLAFLTVPGFYTIFVRVKRNFIRIFTALFCAQSVALIPGMILHKIDGEVIPLWDGSYQMISASIALMSVTLTLYLQLLGRDLPLRKNGVFDFIFAFFGSYSRIRELEEDLSSWENRYHLVMEQSAEAIVISDSSGIVTEANIAAKKLFASNRFNTLIGRDMFELFTADIPVSASLAAGKPLYFKCRVGGKEKIKTLSVSLSPVRLKKQLLLVMVARDITAETQLAFEKEQLANQLVHAQRMESLGVLAGGIAHDFNNFIHAIMGHADVAMLISRGNAEKVDSHLRKITAIAEKAGKLTSQLLGFARQGKYHVVDIEVSTLLDECFGLLEPGRSSQIVLQRDFPERLFMRGDQLQMQQVVMNLLINALDALQDVPEKIILIGSRRAAAAPLKFAPPPDMKDADPGKYICFFVRDNGSGMDDATRRKIFEPFFTTKPVGQGSGMGLAMVYGTVIHHRGWIQLESTPGEGTVFCVFMPHSDIQS